MIIQPLALHDRDKIYRILSQRKNFTAQEIQVAMELVDEALHYPEKKDYLIYCTASTTGELTGYICFGPVPMTEHCYDLYWIAVDEKFSRKGIAGEFLEFMEKFVSEKHGKQVYIDTSSTQAYEAARSFYQKHGYRLMCVLEDFYRQGDHKMIFRKDLLGSEC